MARNIEIKAHIDDIDVLESQVAKVADRGPTEIFQDDTFFQCDAGRLKLRVFSETHGELIFYRRDQQAGPKESFYVRSQTGEPETLRETLALAYGVVGRVVKQRTLYSNSPGITPIQPTHRPSTSIALMMPHFAWCESHFLTQPNGDALRRIIALCQG